MAISRAMRRLLEIREIQEEQSQIALESALGELRRLEMALQFAHARERGGRELVAAGAQTGNLTDRIAGLEETRVAARRASALKPRIGEVEQVVNERREALLERRVERRQAETLIREQEFADAVEATRRAQSGMDDWFLGRLLRTRDDDGDSER
jgi:flagellar biosynthesis chaperone FliJ